MALLLGISPPLPPRSNYHNLLRRHATGAEVFSASSLRNRANLGSSPFDQTSGSERARSSRALIRSLSEEDEERSS